MPYEIEKRGSEFCVVKQTDKSTVKCHPTKEKAEAHLRALYANVVDAKQAEPLTEEQRRRRLIV